jgi:murein L,D-transpeptidase YafK
MIHGSDVSIGCLAMGDPNIEEIYILAVDTGIKNISVIISPTESDELQKLTNAQKLWIQELYQRISLVTSPLPR